MRRRMSFFVTGLGRSSSKDGRDVMLRGDMDISRLMVYVQQVEEKKLSDREEYKSKNQLRDAFLTRYYPVSKKLNNNDRLNNFMALPGESVSSSWNRFASFLRSVPNYRIEDESLKEYFYGGQDDSNKALLDTIVGVQSAHNSVVDDLREEMSQMRTELGLVLKHVAGGEEKANAVNYLSKPPPPNDEYYCKEDSYVVNDQTRGVSDRMPKAPIRRIGAKFKETKVETMVTLPRNTVQNPKNDGYFMAITSWGGKQTIDPPKPSGVEKVIRDDDTVVELSVNVPLVEALEQIPDYEKFMKDLVTKKRSITFEDDDRMQHLSAIATRSLVQKKKDMCAFTIPCRIGLSHFAKSLCDLGASINLMSLSIYKKMGLGDPKPTAMQLLMVDQKGKKAHSSMRGSGELQSVSSISYRVEESYELQIEEHLGVEALAAVIMNFDSDGIEEYGSFVEALDRDLNVHQVESLVKELKKFKRAIGWTIVNNIVIPPGICSHKIQLMPDHKLSIEHQRCISPPMQEVVKKETTKMLDAEVIYPIADNSWVCPFQCVPKKGGMIVVPNEKNELVPMRPVTGWRVHMDYQNLNALTKRDHFPIPFMDQMLDRLAGKGFYGRFIKDFSKIAYPLCKLLEKECKFYFDESCLKAFGELKEKLVSGAIITLPEWIKPFEVIKALNEAQKNYTVTDQELLAVVFDFKKFRSYLLVTTVIVYTDYSALRYLMAKKDLKLRLIRWVLLLEEFDFEVIDRKGTKNQVADQLSRLECEAMRESGDKTKIDDTFPDEHVSCVDGLIRRCVPEVEMLSVLEACHSSPVGGHHSGIRTAHKILQCGYYWLTIHQDVHEFAKACDRCQRDGRISRKQELPSNPIRMIELFDVWGIDFMVLFVSSDWMKYILVAVDYVPKWVEAITLVNNEGNSITAFLKKNIFYRFGTPGAIISDGGSHFCNKLFKGLLEKYGVCHNVATPYHPQTSGQVQVSNKEIKQILLKTVNASRTDW
ncbi:uncharacterized protein [Solanum lycopersicum]|uniref:uncharacterized protein n=1 Tax=Solanum lycopersicum TaxID=4081 RepID=UPI00374A0567